MNQKLYAVRKRRGQWAVCSDENVVLQFETYDEAVATARGAVTVLAGQPQASADTRDLVGVSEDVSA